MNRKILQKCIDELNKENPKLDYVRGILETIIDTLPEEKGVSMPVFNGLGSVVPCKTEVNAPVDEGNLLDSEASARLKNIKLQYD